MLESGANKEAKDTYNNSPLHAAVWQGNFFIVKHLIEKGANTEAANENGNAPLHFAAHQGHPYCRLAGCRHV